MLFRSGEAQKVTNYVKFKSFGKAKDVNLELGVDAHCNLDLELSALNGKIVYYDGGAELFRAGLPPDVYTNHRRN